MLKDQMIDGVRASVWGRALGLDKTDSVSLISDGIELIAEYFWHYYHWTFRKASTTITVDEETETLPENIDAVCEVTYDDSGGYPRYIRFHGNDFIANTYDGNDDTGSELYYWDIFSYDNGQLIARFKPTIDSGKTVTLRYYKKYQSLSEIPSKYHPIIFLGLRGYLTEGDMVNYPPFINAINSAIFKDKPHRIKKDKMSKDRTFGRGIK